MSKKVIGIDLGTSFSAVATIENGKPVVITNSEGARTTPSVVYVEKGERKVGDPARRQRVVHPKNTVSTIKRFMGVDYDKCTDIIKKMTYDVVNENGKPRVKIDDRTYSPEEISSYILNKMKMTAEDYIGEKVSDAVITVPAWFDSAARECTKIAGEMCGLNVLRVINEPTAAILASDIDLSKGDKKVLVADIGGGTTDFSVCELSEGMVEVLASHGDVFLGGTDFDNTVAEWIVKAFKTDEGVDLSKDPQAMQRVLEASEKAKIELSSSSTTEINLPYITARDGMPLHLMKTLSRAEFEHMTQGLVDKIIECGKEALKQANVAYDELDCILLVGGQSRSIAIQRELTNTFGVTLNKSVNPDEAVALGAAVQANIIVGGEGSKDILLLDVTPLTLGIETMGGVMTAIVEANTTIPVRRSQIFTTAADNQPSVTISVLQGARPMARDNKEIGRFNLDGIPPAPRGVPQIEVTFEIDVNGLLSVSAKDKGTNIKQTITIENKNSVSQEEIERIKREAEEHAEEDARTKEMLDKQNKCESLIFSTEKLLENMKEHVTDEDRKFFDEQLTKLKGFKDNGDYTGLDAVEGEINKRWNDISVKAYSAGQPGSADNPFNVNVDDILNGKFTAPNTDGKKDDPDVEVQDATIL